VGSIILIAAAARDLGKAYDRCGGEENVRQAVVESSSHAGYYLKAFFPYNLQSRIVIPDHLVTTGVYSFIQHPIYTSYMLLFFGHCMLLHSAPLALMMLAVCVMYYR
jgi:protein-S-isoprenylcysteine O-methyltransferase Ste14